MLARLPAAAGHGFVYEPASRNYVRNWRYCPHCANNGGPGVCSDGGRLVWPATTQPACGARSLMDAGPVVQAYTPGSVINITVFITVQHGGRHAFRICPYDVATAPCFVQHPLNRTDGGGPYSWTPTNGGPVPGGKYSRVVVDNRQQLPGAGSAALRAL
ncbi:hypothetical protein ABPG77_002641 [Micractinium sp. CCAP 211/92]